MQKMGVDISNFWLQSLLSQKCHTQSLVFRTYFEVIWCIEFEYNNIFFKHFPKNFRKINFMLQMGVLQTSFWHQSSLSQKCHTQSLVYRTYFEVVWYVEFEYNNIFCKDFPKNFRRFDFMQKMGVSIPPSLTSGPLLDSASGCTP